LAFPFLTGFADLTDIISAQGFSDRSSRYLAASIADSSRKSYSSAFKLFAEWLSDHDFSLTTLTTIQIANYLAETADRISYNAVIVHRSAILFFLSQSNRQALIQNDHIRSLMRGIKKLKQVIKTVHPIWNIETVFPYVRELATKKSFSAISQHLALIILLFGCKRISDLCHLSIDAKFFNLTHDSLLLYQSHSKSSSRTGTSNPCILRQNISDPKLCPIRSVNRFLKASGKRSKENKNLFISLSDPTLPITIHAVRKWVKDMLLSTGVKATPGSTRKAATSHLIQAGINMDEILEKGGWAELRTMMTHYVQPVLPRSTPPRR